MSKYCKHGIDPMHCGQCDTITGKPLPLVPGSAKHYYPEPGDEVRWWHSDRRGTKNFAGVVVGQSNCGGPYYKVRRADTNKIVKVRTSALRRVQNAERSEPRGTDQ